MKLSKTNIALGIVCAALAGTTVYLYRQNSRQAEEATNLNRQLSELAQKEKRSAVLQSISRQMEEIAYQQKDISEEQRLEAVEQTRLAQQMRNQSEVERQNALVAQHAAMESERKALDAYEAAENQRIAAEHERSAAELSRRHADTLRFLSVAQAVANVSVTRYQAGEKQLAAMLACVSYDLNLKNGGNIFQPDIYQALTLSLGSISKWNHHRGALTCMSLIPAKEKMFVTGSGYGDLYLQQFDKMKLTESPLFSDHAYDWRDVLYDEDETIYALSFTGHLYVNKVSHGTTVKKRGTAKTAQAHTVVELPAKEYTRMVKQGRYLLLFANHAITWYDTQAKQAVNHQPLDFTLSTASTYKGSPCLFSTTGKMYVVDEHQRLRAIEQPFKGQVTAFCYAPESGLSCYGTKNGNVYVVSDDGHLLELVGHRSRISKVDIAGSNIYSSSYDGTIKSWDLSEARLEPVTLYKGNRWVHTFFVQQKKDFLWAGTSDGTLIDVAILPSEMAERLKQNLGRNLTREEWNTYIGKNVPYQTFM